MDVNIDNAGEIDGGGVLLDNVTSHDTDSSTSPLVKPGTLRPAGLQQCVVLAPGLQRHPPRHRRGQTLLENGRLSLQDNAVFDISHTGTGKAAASMAICKSPPPARSSSTATTA